MNGLSILHTRGHVFTHKYLEEIFCFYRMLVCAQRGKAGYNRHGPDYLYSYVNVLSILHRRSHVFTQIFGGGDMGVRCGEGGGESYRKSLKFVPEYLASDQHGDYSNLATLIHTRYVSFIFYFCKVMMATLIDTRKVRTYILYFIFTK